MRRKQFKIKFQIALKKAGIFLKFYLFLILSKYLFNFITP